MHIKVNLIVSLRDGFTGQPHLKGAVSVRMENGICAIKKEEGTFVFFNCPPGNYQIQILAALYNSQRIFVEINDTVQQIAIDLMPGRNYRFSGEVTKLYGNAHKSAWIAFPEPEQIRLVEAVKKGSRRVHLFFRNSVGKALGGMYYFSDADHRGIYRLLQPSACDPALELENPAEFEFSVSSQIGRAYRIEPDETGTYFLAVQGRFAKAVVLTEQKAIELELNKSETNYENKF